MTFYQLTPEKAKALIKAKLTAAEWRIWIYLIETSITAKKPPDPATVMRKCDIKKATYYRAIKKLQELNLIP